MSDKKLDKKYARLRKELRGYYKTIAKKSKKSKATVSLVLQGKLKNTKVLDVALAIHKDVMAKRAEQINKLDGL